jgi:hypothetical protein
MKGVSLLLVERGPGVVTKQMYQTLLIPHHTMPYHAIPYHTILYHTIPYYTIPYHTIPYHTLTRNCMGVWGQLCSFFAHRVYVSNLQPLAPRISPLRMSRYSELCVVLCVYFVCCVCSVCVLHVCGVCVCVDACCVPPMIRMFKLLVFQVPVQNLIGKENNGIMSTYRAVYSRSDVIGFKYMMNNFNHER